MGWPVSGPDLPLSSGFITEEASAKYLLVALAEFFNRGIPRSFIYSLIDDGHRNPPRYHGLLTDPDLVKRKSFTAVKNLMKRINDPGEAFEPQGLEFELEGLDGTNVHHLPLMQKRDGTFIFILWQDTDSYDRTAKKNLNPAPVNVTLDLEKPMSCKLFKPTFTADIIKEAESSSFLIPVEDELMIVEVSG
jgi:hypothetical protein